MFAACYAGDGVAYENEDGPEEAGDECEGATEGLDGEGGGIGVWDVVGAASMIKGD